MKEKHYSGNQQAHAEEGQISTKIRNMKVTRLIPIIWNVESEGKRSV